MTPYYSDDFVTLYHGDCRELLPTMTADVVVTDPPYGETSLAWDTWPTLWPALISTEIRQLWCFGSLRMFLDRRDDFAGWKLAQDVIWEKPRGTSFVADRFARVHEHALHWYRADWGSLPLTPQREATHGKRIQLPQRKGKTEYVHGAIGQKVDWVDDGQRLVRSVLHVDGVRQGQRGSLHPTEKPTGILEPLIAYSCPPDGTVLDPFAGSGSTLDAARRLGRKAIGVEAHEPYCEVIANRLSQGAFDFGGAA